MIWRTDTRLFIRFFVACNILLAVYNLISFKVFTHSTKPCVILAANNSVPKPQPQLPVEILTKDLPEVQVHTETENSSKSSVDLKQRGQYFVATNFITPERSYAFNESITLTTQGTIDFLHHVPILCRRWAGPVAIAVYAPGPELNQALKMIGQMRQCDHACVRENVTWHLIFDIGDEEHPFPEDDNLKINCSGGTLKISSNYRQVTKKTYPINVLRNVARQSATTRYIMASDIELYPSANIIPRFLRMLENEAKIRKTSPNVYVLPIFEVDKNEQAPETKTELVFMLKNNKAIYFHKWVCDSCQNFPGRAHWTDTIPGNDTLDIFITTKRDRTHNSWEPIYIGTNNEPLYDERLSWDGKRDKMSQMYEMCLLRYTLLVLDNAFLVHAPGIKTINKNELNLRAPHVRRNNAIYGQAMKELKKKYKDHSNC